MKARLRGFGLMNLWNGLWAFLRGRRRDAVGWVGLSHYCHTLRTFKSYQYLPRTALMVLSYSTLTASKSCITQAISH